MTSRDNGLLELMADDTRRNSPIRIFRKHENVPSNHGYNRKHLLLALSFFKISVHQNTHPLNIQFWFVAFTTIDYPGFNAMKW